MILCICFNPLYTENPYKRCRPKEMPHIMWHFIRVYTVCKGKKDLQTKTQYFFKLQPDTPKYVQWTIPSLMYQARRKNPLVYKGLSTRFS